MNRFRTGKLIPRIFVNQAAPFNFVKSYPTFFTQFQTYVTRKNNLDDRFKPIGNKMLTEFNPEKEQYSDSELENEEEKPEEENNPAKNYKNF